VFTTDELNCKFRIEVADPLEGDDSGTEPDSENLWKDHEIYGYATEAADAVARDTQGLYKLVELPVVVDENVVSLPRYILHIRFARLVTANSQVVESNQDDIMTGTVCDYGVQLSGGLLRARGRPRSFARDRERKALVIAPTPTQADTLELQCSVTIATPLLCGMPLPFLELPDQRLMLHFMKYLAYAKQDADVLDLARSESFKARYDSEVAERAVELRNQRRRPSPIAMEW